MFDVTTIPMTSNRKGELVVAPGDLYPTVIARIKEALAEYRRQTAAGEINLESIAPELVTTPGRGGDARARVLLRNALALPDKAWDNALRPRTEFHPIDYKAIDLEMLRALGVNKAGLAQIQEVKDRGDALEIAMGWFLHALRLKVGSFSLVIGSGAPAGSDPSDLSLRPYRL